MEKKSIILLLAGVIFLSGCFIGGQYLFAHADSWITAHPTGYTDQNPPLDTTSVVLLTGEDFAKHPILRDLIEHQRTATITEDPFVIMKLSGPHISKAEAAELIAAYHSFYSGYLYWNGVYYSLAQMVT